MEKVNSSISNFNQFLQRHLIPFLLLLGLFAVAFNYFFEKQIILKSQTTGAYKLYRIINETHADEIPIFGSSRAAGCYVPEYISAKSFNYGVEDTQYELLDVFLKQELQKNKTTPLLINFDYTFFDKWFGDMSNYLFNVDNADVRNYIGEKYKPYFRIPTIKYFGSYEHYFKFWLADNSKKNYHSQGGFFLKTVFVQSELDKEIKERYNTVTKWMMDSTMHYKLIHHIQNNPTRKFIFCIAPYHKSFIDMFEGKETMEEYITMLKKFPNVTFLNYARANYPDSLFINTTHLNFEGAKRFSQELQTELIKIDSLQFN